MQTRLNDIKGEEGNLARLHFATVIDRLNEGGAEALDKWLTDHPEARLVVIDTLKKIRKKDGRARVYDVDYEAVEPLIPLAAKHNVSIMVVHHNNKMENPQDAFDVISSSTGLTGSVDGVLIMTRKRDSDDAYLLVDGRDIQDRGDFALSWDENNKSWTLQGDAREYRLSKEKLDILRVLEQEARPMHPDEIADVLEIKPNTAKTRCYRMAREGELQNTNGRFSPSITYKPFDPDKTPKSETGETDGCSSPSDQGFRSFTSLTQDETRETESGSNGNGHVPEGFKEWWKHNRPIDLGNWSWKDIYYIYGRTYRGTIRS